MSSLGDMCHRRLWLEYHKGFKEAFPGRMLRLFKMGNTIEKIVISDLRAAGYRVTGRQQAFHDFGRRLRGHCDGIIEGLRESSRPHILEVKSASDKSFKEFQAKGLSGHSYADKYEAQLQMYMGYAGLDRALFVVENKNDQARYSERVRFDFHRFGELREKARNIINARLPPRGISDRPDWYQCKYCHLNNEVNCRKKWEGELLW